MKTHWWVAMGLVTLSLVVGVENGTSQKTDKRADKTDCKVTTEPIVYRNQGWTDEERCQFYHFSQNARLLNYRWFSNLEDPWKPGKQFVENLTQYGLLPDQKSDFNPDGLPVGLTKTDNPYIRPPQVGFTCAFCHTGQITYEGKHYRIDGGPSMQQNAKFLRALATALRLTLEEPDRFKRFAKKVLTVPGKEHVIETKGPATEDDIKRLRSEMKSELARFSRQGRIDPVEWGPGRFDALGRGGNMIFYESQWGSAAHGKGGQPLFSSDNLRPANGPVSLPHLWGAWEKDWVLWGGVIQSPVARSMVEALSIDTALQMYDDLGDPFPVDVQRLIFLDSKGQQLQPPLWPDAFGTINETLKAQGQELFGKEGGKGLCAGCHIPVLLPEPTPHGQRWHVSSSSIHEIGTDKLTAMNWFTRRVHLSEPLPDLLDMPAVVDMPSLIQRVTQTVIQRHRDTMLRNEKDIKPINNVWRKGVDKDGQTCTKEDDCQPAYIARPLDGIWATAPYLHNGSVPNLYALLSPIEERPLAFCVGPNVEFDPETVGLIVRQCPETQLDPHSVDFHFDAGKAGNRNIGHEFRGQPGKPLNREGREDKNGPFFCDVKDRRPPGVLGCEIAPEDRKALVEYLKIIKTPGLQPRTERADERPAMAP